MYGHGTVSPAFAFMDSDSLDSDQDQDQDQDIEDDRREQTQSQSQPQSRADPLPHVGDQDGVNSADTLSSSMWVDAEEQLGDALAALLERDEQLLHHPTQCFADMCWADAVCDLIAPAPAPAPSPRPAAVYNTTTTTTADEEQQLDHHHHARNQHPELASTSPALVGPRRAPGAGYHYDHDDVEHEHEQDFEADDEDEDDDHGAAGDSDEGEDDYGGVQAAVLAAAPFNKPSRFTHHRRRTVPASPPTPPAPLPITAPPITIPTSPIPIPIPIAAPAPMTPLSDRLNTYFPTAALKRLAEEPFALDAFDDFDAKPAPRPSPKPPVSSTPGFAPTPTPTPNARARSHTYTFTSSSPSPSPYTHNANLSTPNPYTHTPQPQPHATNPNPQLFFAPADPSESIGFFPTRPPVPPGGKGGRVRASSLLRYFSFSFSRVRGLGAQP
ncbi:hypothetical protein C8R46DRAFT_1070893 [Mycena filopes]|nr:hypothetical protein C8R46DRAFT_1070893 [Mycena filopes]